MNIIFIWILRICRMGKEYEEKNQLDFVIRHGVSTIVALKYSSLHVSAFVPDSLFGF